MEFWSFPSSLRSLLAPNRVNYLNTLTAICEICCRQSAGKWENNNKTLLAEKTKFTSRINRGAHKSMLQNGNSFRCVSVCVWVYWLSLYGCQSFWAFCARKSYWLPSGRTDWAFGCWAPQVFCVFCPTRLAFWQLIKEANAKKDLGAVFLQNVKHATFVAFSTICVISLVLFILRLSVSQPVCLSNFCAAFSAS